MVNKHGSARKRTSRTLRSLRAINATQVFSPTHSALCIRIGLYVALSLLGTTVGCERGPKLVPVNGRAVFNAKNLEYGSVMFQPIGGGELARASIQSDGTFVLTTKKEGDGAIVGKHRVRVTSFEAQSKRGIQDAGKDEPTLGKSAIPARFNSFATSGLTVEVLEGMELPVVLDLGED